MELVAGPSERCDVIWTRVLFSISAVDGRQSEYAGGLVCSVDAVDGRKEIPY